MFEGHGAITSYQILVKSTFYELKIYTENAITNYTASGLSFNTKYNFSVAAVVCGKVGQFSEPLVANTGTVLTISTLLVLACWHGDKNYKLEYNIVTCDLLISACIYIAR